MAAGDDQGIARTAAFIKRHAEEPPPAAAIEFHAPITLFNGHDRPAPSPAAAGLRRTSTRLAGGTSGTANPRCPVALG